MCYFGSRTTQGFEELKVEIARLKCCMEQLYNSTKEVAEDGIRTMSNNNIMFVIQPLSTLKATMVARVTATAMRKLGNTAVVKMLDT